MVDLFLPPTQEEGLARKTQAQLDWLKNFNVEYMNALIKSCQPISTPFFTFEEFQIFKNDSSINHWFNFQVTNGMGWIWRKYTIIEQIESWRKLQLEKVMELNYEI